MVLRNHVTCLNNTRLKVTTTDPNRGLVRACNKPIDESCVINFDHLQYQAIFSLHPQTLGLKPYLATKKESSDQVDYSTYHKFRNQIHLHRIIFFQPSHHQTQLLALAKKLTGTHC